MKDYKTITPEALITKGENFMMTLALIRNDMSDLLYLQKLHHNSSKDVPEYVCAARGQKAGRDIFILRILLSQIWIALEFLKMKNKDLYTSPDVVEAGHGLNESDKKTWRCFLQISRTMTNNGVLDTDTDLASAISETMAGLSVESVKRIILASYITRNRLTFHYHGTSSALKEGYVEAFTVGVKDERNRSACFTDSGNVTDLRAYYIDFALQKYLEKHARIPKDIMMDESFVEEVISFGSNLYFIMSLLVEHYHARLVVQYKK